MMGGAGRGALGPEGGLAGIDPGRTGRFGLAGGPLPLGPGGGPGPGPGPSKRGLLAGG